MDFIEVYDNVLQPAECKEIIKYFNEMKKHNLVFSRQELNEGHAHEKQDEACFLFEPDTFYLDKTHPIIRSVLDKVASCYKQYSSKYSIIAKSLKHGVISTKVQKTEPGGGYHAWHYENEGRLASGRFLAFMVYLNTVAVAGETEFLYQRKRVNPVEGRVVIWPAAFTHTHRGNPPISGDKYIVTGWIEFLE